jgi:hypothetical protein
VPFLTLSSTGADALRMIATHKPPEAERASEAQFPLVDSAQNMLLLGAVSRAALQAFVHRDRRLREMIANVDCTQTNQLWRYQQLAEDARRSYAGPHPFKGPVTVGGLPVLGRGWHSKGIDRGARPMDDKASVVDGRSPASSPLAIVICHGQPTPSCVTGGSSAASCVVTATERPTGSTRCTSDDPKGGSEDTFPDSSALADRDAESVGTPATVRGHAGGGKDWVHEPLPFDLKPSSNFSVGSTVDVGDGLSVPVDLAPFAVSHMTPTALIHYLFAICFYGHMYVTDKGKLVGVLYKGKCVWACMVHGHTNRIICI